MTRFATIALAPDEPRAKGKKHPLSGNALVWEQSEDGRFRVVARVQDLDALAELEGAADIEVFAFDVPTSDQTLGPANKGRQPVFDADGAPLWAGARISFRLPSFYINTYQGTGTYTESDAYGGTRFRSDELQDVFDRNGSIVERRHEQYSSVQTYASNGEFNGCRLLTSKLGDKYEHGQVVTYIRLEDDPRSVCKPVLAPRSPAP